MRIQREGDERKGRKGQEKEEGRSRGMDTGERKIGRSREKKGLGER